MLIFRVMFAHFFCDHRGILILENLGANFFIHFLCVFSREIRND